MLWIIKIKAVLPKKSDQAAFQWFYSWCVVHFFMLDWIWPSPSWPTDTVWATPAWIVLFLWQNNVLSPYIPHHKAPHHSRKGQEEIEAAELRIFWGCLFPQPEKNGNCGFFPYVVMYWLHPQHTDSNSWNAKNNKWHLPPGRLWCGESTGLQTEKLNNSTVVM